MSTAAIRTSRKGAQLRWPMGRIPTTDPRNEGYLLRASAHVFAAKPIRPKLTLDLRGRWDQTIYPACVGFTAFAHLNCKPALIGRSKLTPIGIYQAAQIYDEIPGEGYEGTTVLGALKFLTKHQDAKDIKEYRWARTVDEMNRHMNDQINSGVLVGTNWYDSMFYPDKEGIVRIKQGGVVSGHAYYRVGYDTQRGLGQYQNSWKQASGEWWGKNGRFYLSFEDEQRLLDEDGEAGVTIKYQKGE